MGGAGQGTRQRAVLADGHRSAFQRRSFEGGASMMSASVTPWDIAAQSDMRFLPHRAGSSALASGNVWAI